MSAADIDTVCTSNARNELEHAAATLDAQPAYSDTVANAAALAGLGRGERRARALRGLTADDERDALVAQVYLRHHPLHDADELRSVTRAIARMTSGASQVRALDTIAAMRIADRESLATLALLFPRTKSIEVQRAIAGVLIRAAQLRVREAGETARAVALALIEVVSDRADQRVGVARRALESPSEQDVGLALAVGVGREHGVDPTISARFEQRDQAILVDRLAEVKEAATAPGADRRCARGSHRGGK